ncbi:LD-carboxypeptidase [Streptomyces sulfonofaciens]|uniref:LD-carboxypeptidase n=1 Tax=Streptomyces sulfonofaciens TaxID=68272 RepID=A0A919L575_9ACTN|nr:LD-carboxypeptidase [Streptomyces sulfonofaciens]
MAVLSPSSGLPGALPLPFELGLRRLREFGLEPVEYATTRLMGASPQDRAADLHKAFADPTISAVIASIGGDDQITLLPYLDANLIGANPKPFFGYSDNTVLLAYLWQRGIVGYYGGSVMSHFGRPGAMHPLTAESLQAALFGGGEYELQPAKAFTDVDRPWSEEATFEAEPELRPADDWIWHNAHREVTGVSWGGTLDVLSWLLMADQAVSPADAYADGVLFIETSEELPSARTVYRSLRSMGERGLLGRFAAVLVGRPKAWSFERRTTPKERVAFSADQHEAVLRALQEYAPEATVVQNVDLGHTDPHLVIPYGGLIRVDGPARRIHVTY